MTVGCFENEILGRLEPSLGNARTCTPDMGIRELTALEVFQLSQAISLKRIADALHREPGAGLPTFLDQLSGVLSDASHDHAQRMR